MKSYRKITFVLLVFVMTLLSACSLPGSVGAPTQISVDAIYTAAAETLQAQLTQSAAEQPPTEIPPAQPPTDTPPPPEAIPTDTPTPEFTDTPAFTPTPTRPMIGASVNTNCRKGPSKLYDPPVGVLRIGDKVEVHGRNPDRSWWYIQNPGKEGQFCWVWADTTNVEGDSSALPVVEPPPLPPTPTYTPTPDIEFDPSFDNVHNCGGDPYAIFELDNTGGVAFESMRLVIVDLDDDDEIYDDDSNAPFMGAGGECPPGGDTFPANKTFWVGGNIEDGGSGHKAEATITLCTQNNLKGTCVKEDVKFDIP